jgi:DNA polymerase I
MSKWVFDIETNDLLQKLTRMWILCAYNLNTRKLHYWLEGDLGWQEEFDKATLVVGHNILGFDVFALKKLFGYEFPKTCNMHDTLIMSQTLDYKRFGNEGHSLRVWGDALGFPKGDHSDWSQFSEEMLEYCKQDVLVSVKVYETLLEEYHHLVAKAPAFKHYLRAEHAATKWSTEASLQGWPFDIEAAADLYSQLEAKMQEALNALEQKLGTKTVPTDKSKGIVEFKVPKWTKAGCYDAHTARWFDVDPWAGFEERPIEGPYSRVEFEALKLSSVADVKIFLNRNGWQPTEWNFKVDPENPRKKIKASPKITEDSLEFLGGDGKLYSEYATAKARLSILKTWLENIDELGNLHGDCMVIGTPSMRARHSIIVNVPSTDSAWGKEMRSLFIARPGWSLIGCDSSGNQARGLAHYLGDPKFIDTLLNGDIHQFNADILTSILRNSKLFGNKYADFEVKRSQAKRILYAFLFGASGSKLWSYIFGVLDEENGKKLKNQFIKAVPGFKVLLEKLNNIYGSTQKFGDGYIPGLAGNRVYVDSVHKLLVYLLQAAEKATCSTALMYTVQKFEEEQIPYIPCIFYHDEIDFMVPDEFAERAAAIGKEGFKEGPKLYGIQIMDGDAKIGRSWYEVH